MADLYIYYRVRDEDAATLAPRVRAMQAQLAGADAPAGQLKRRPLSSDGMQTWMEIYPARAAGFESELDAAVQRAGLLDLIDGKRHTEVFMDLSPCA